MFTLQTFYKSKEWQKLLAVLKLERLDDSGQLICWHCGKPITRAYDAIGHHTIFLTEENVNDAEVSLNPSLIKFVHHRCHNIIHNKLGYTKKEVFLVYGPPLSGKHDWVELNRSDGDLIVDIDSIWECISGCRRYIKPGKLNSVAFNVRDALMAAIKTRLGKWDNAYIIGGFPLVSERERLCRELGAREIYIESDKAACINRASSLNLPEYERFIEQWFERFLPATTIDGELEGPPYPL